MLNKKILLSVLTIGVLAVVAGAGTWAYFSDTVETNGNTITTGTIILTPGGAIGSTTPYAIGPIVPGDEVTDYNAGTLANGGTVDGDLTGIITVSSDSGALPADMVITVGVGPETVTLGLGDNAVPSQKLVSGTNVPITISVAYPNTDTEQSGQGVKITASGTFVLKSNPDYTNAI